MSSQRRTNTRRPMTCRPSKTVARSSRPTTAPRPNTAQKARAARARQRWQ